MLYFGFVYSHSKQPEDEVHRQTKTFQVCVGVAQGSHQTKGIVKEILALDSGVDTLEYMYESHITQTDRLTG